MNNAITLNDVNALLTESGQTPLQTVVEYGDEVVYLDGETLCFNIANPSEMKWLYDFILDGVQQEAEETQNQCW